jgi:hypothetical protein
MTPMNNRRALIDRMLTALQDAAKDRDKRWDMVEVPGRFPEPAWVFHERDVMLREVNLVRQSLGFPAAGIEQVERIECGAAGHTDYATKLAAGCAELAVTAPQGRADGVEEAVTLVELDR